MAVLESKPYNLGISLPSGGISLSSYHFSYDNGKLVGISKQAANVSGTGAVFKPVDPSTNEFTDIANTDESLDAFNYMMFGKKGVVDNIETASNEELANFYAQKKKKTDNASFEQPQTAEFATPQSVGYESNLNQSRFGGSLGSQIMAYPLDIDPDQDHFKISKHNYVRADINQSKGANDVRIKTLVYKGASGEVRTRGEDIIANRAGDSVVGSELMGSILLPMPKATDVNGVAWGKSELNISGLAALGAVKAVDNLGPLVTGGKTLSGITPDEQEMNRRIKEAIENRTRPEGAKGNGINVAGSSAAEASSAMITTMMAKTAGFAFGTELDTDTVLARTGGKVLNPNAEMLFQGPSIRDFAFSFIMVARSKQEGQEIRKIIRFLKLGMAPKFRSTTYLTNPDIFTLAYRKGSTTLNTVNRFNPGGLALTTMNVDYAPDSYWSAYTDSQPVVLKMDLNFTELRPIYQSDQEGTPEDSVGY